MRQNDVALIAIAGAVAAKQSNPVEFTRPVTSHIETVDLGAEPICGIRRINRNHRPTILYLQPRWLRSWPQDIRARLPALLRDRYSITKDQLKKLKCPKSSSVPFGYMSATLRLHETPLELRAGKPILLQYGVAVWDGRVDVKRIDSVREAWLRRVGRTQTSSPRDLAIRPPLWVLLTIGQPGPDGLPALE